MSWIVYFICLFLCGCVIFRSSFFSSDFINRKWVLVLFLLKLAGGFALWYIYTYHYTDRSSSDIFTYFDDGMIIHSSIHQSWTDFLKLVTGIGADNPALMKYYDTCNFWIKEFNYGLLNDNRIIIRFHAIIRLFSMGNFHTHNLVFGFLSFTGLWAIYKTFAPKLKGKELLLIIVVFFFPSIWFWTSGALKEAILMFAFAMFLYHVLKMYDTRINLISLIWILFTIAILLLSKFYILITVLPGILYVFFLKYSGTQYGFGKWVGAHLFFIFMMAVSGYLTGYDLVSIICNKQHDFVNYINSLSQVGSAIPLPALDQGIASLLWNAPMAFGRALFRPTIFETGSLTLHLAAIENTLIIIAFIFTLIFFDRKKIKQPWFWFCLSFVLILFTLIGLTTPVLGALVRYKAPALPFLGIALLVIIQDNYVSRISQLFKK